MRPDIDRGALDHIAAWSARLSPARMVAVMAALQVVAWSLVPALLYASPPLDVVESYVHGPHWPLVTLKHPALPSWVLEASRIVTGSVGWPPYVISQLFIAATFAAVYLLGRDLLGSIRAAAGTMLLAGLGYVMWPSIEFNHNVALMPLWAGFYFALWRAVERDSLGWWFAVAIIAALMMYTKLSSATAFVVGGLWLLADPAGRRQLTRPGPWLAAIVFAALVAPLYLALRANGFAPLQYAAARAESGGGPLTFVGAQLLVLSGLVLMVAIVRGYVRREAADAVPVDLPAVDDRARRYLYAVTFGPLALVIVAAAVTGASLRSNWAAPMLSFSGLVAVVALGRMFTPAWLPHVFRAALVLLLAVPTVFAAVHVGRAAYEARPSRAHWPQAEIARTFRELWQRETGRPLRHVAGHFWPAGLVALSGRDMPTVIVDGNLAAAPGVTVGRLIWDGVLIVNTGNMTEVPPTLTGLRPPLRTGELTFAVPGARRGQSVTLRYAIVAPE